MKKIAYESRKLNATNLIYLAHSNEVVSCHSCFEGMEMLFSWCKIEDRK